MGDRMAPKARKPPVFPLQYPPHEPCRQHPRGASTTTTVPSDHIPLRGGDSNRPTWACRVRVWCAPPTRGRSVKVCVTDTGYNVGFFSLFPRVRILLSPLSSRHAAGPIACSIQAHVHSVDPSRVMTLFSHLIANLLLHPSTAMVLQNLLVLTLFASHVPTHLHTHACHTPSKRPRMNVPQFITRFASCELSARMRTRVMSFLFLWPHTFHE
jgi:hypothetical protein